MWWPRTGIAICALICALAVGAPAQTKAGPKAPGKAARKSAVQSKSSKSKSKKTAKAKAPARQTQPTPERYAEIERALQDRGYLASAADGNWDKESIEALKRFQRDQSLKDDGKLGALTLTALGLGPRRVSPGAAQLSLPAAD